MIKLTKKKNRFEVFLEGSKMIQTILVLVGIALFGFLDYWLVRLECSLILKNLSLNVGNVIILMLMNVSALFVLNILVIPEFRKLIALNNYCYIPLTEDEVRSFGFTSAREYFNHVAKKLYYGDDIFGLIHYVHLKHDDLQKMLAVCLKVFPDNGTIFDLQFKDCEYICSFDCKIDFFLDTYHHDYENDKNYVPSANINKDGTVSLSVLNKDGYGITWSGSGMSERTKENE